MKKKIINIPYKQITIVKSSDMYANEALIQCLDEMQMCYHITHHEDHQGGKWIIDISSPGSGEYLCVAMANYFMDVLASKKIRNHLYAFPVNDRDFFGIKNLIIRMSSRHYFPMITLLGWYLIRYFQHNDRLLIDPFVKINLDPFWKNFCMALNDEEWDNSLDILLTNFALLHSDVNEEFFHTILLELSKVPVSNVLLMDEVNITFQNKEMIAYNKRTELNIDSAFRAMFGDNLKEHNTFEKKIAFVSMFFLPDLIILPSNTSQKRIKEVEDFIKLYSSFVGDVTVFSK